MSESNRSYKKYKLIVKTWEKQFMKEKCRVPSKHDIKEAPTKVRTAYKYYFKLKSEILESSLMDMEFDEDCLTVDGFDSSQFLETTEPDMDIVFKNIPSANDIKKLMDNSINNVKGNLDFRNSIDDEKKRILPDSCGVSKTVWGNHLNITPTEVKSKPGINAFNRQDFTATELFKSCSFKKRNPRKSISFQNVKPVKASSKSEINTEYRDHTGGLLADKSVEEIFKNTPETLETEQKSRNGKLVHIENVIDNVKINSEKNLSSEKLSICNSFSGEKQDTKIKLVEETRNTEGSSFIAKLNIQETVFSDFETKCVNERLNELESQYLSKRSSQICSVNPINSVIFNSDFSVRNLNANWINRCSDAQEDNKTNVVCQADGTQNNENENTQIVTQMQNNYGLKNIDVRQLSFVTHLSKMEDHNLSDFVENSESEAEHSQYNYKKIRPVVKKCKMDKTVLNETIKDEVGGGDNEVGDPKVTRKKKVKGKVTKKTRTANENVRSTKVQRQKSNKRNTRTKRKNVDPSSESEYEETIVRRSTIHRNKRNQSKVSDSTECEDTQDYPNLELEKDFIGEHISYPRFPICSSILKESNLVDGFTAAIKIPKESILSLSKKLTKKVLSEEEKLQKKIEDGSLNDNFVRINIEKKVYARGKKTMTFSKFKKQQWKNLKKTLHHAPEFPEGGVLKCFKCGQPGHMSRYCTAGRSGSLLPLKECRENSPHISIHEADNLKNMAETLNISDSLQFECINKSIAESEKENGFVEKSLNAIQPISETFIKLLNSSSVSSNFSQQYIDPLYKLSDNGSFINTPDEVMEALNLFGHQHFRSGQETAVMRILSGLSTLVTLSTGSGKSLCYQLPAYLYAKRNKCITLVISPLVSLMEDQVANMPSFVHAACLHTNQPPSQREKIMELIKKGNVHILLISPEAIVAGEKSTGFGAVLKQLPPIAFACIDEVHCVSQWSHNFRPSYLMICRVLREKLGVKCVLGLTATATKPTMMEIVQHLQIHDGIQGIITNKPLPDNLVLTVSRDPQRDHSLLELLVSDRFSKCDSIIIYCIRRDECERVASLIRSAMQHPEPGTVLNNGSKKRKRFNWIVEAYHAGMSAAKRRKVQRAFMSGELRIVVATVAFGMGIDKSNIRGVIHYNMPSSFESYVQEVGRAGRDGLSAQCHVFIDREFKDKDELLRHIHANSIERHVIRKLLQKVFVPCSCNKMLKSVNEDEDVQSKCQGHEVAFAINETVSELDLPSENISTLLCYLELHPKKFAKNLSSVYITCKITSYGGPAALLEAAERCPPLAMAIALEKKKGGDLDITGTMEFCVIEVAAAIGWESGVVKYHLKNLEWTKQNGLPKKSLLRVEFNTLGFRVKSPGDLTSSELDAALDTLYERAQLQEKSMLYQLQHVSKTLSDVSFSTFSQCSSLDMELYTKQSNNLKEVIRNYFSHEILGQEELVLDERPINKDHVIADVRGLLATYRDCTFTGRAVARIFQGISSPNFPAIVWGRCRYWRSHLSEDFYKLVNIATQQIISSR